MLSTSFLQNVKFVFKVFTILITCAGMSACFFSQNSAPTSDLSHTRVGSKNIDSQHIVKRGETLYSIAWRYGLDYKQLARSNNIGNDFLIRPGQVLKLAVNNVPVAKARSTQSNNSRVASASVKPKVPTTSKSQSQTVSRDKKLSTGYPAKTPSRSEKKSSSPKTLATSKLDARTVVWRWPAKGEVLTNFSIKNTTNKGIDIKGKKGDSVLAAASGNVVYAGSGLRGYGKLIIIKHNDVYLSAYAHNSKIRVKEGQYVKAGQYIANIGSSGSRTEGAKLHFEIRRNGKPIDPLRLLPRRKS